MGEPTMSELLDRLASIEGKLDMLIMALAEEDDEGFALDGSPMGVERDTNQPL